jgi:DNA mismatch endonuclease (patch repair protein)
MDTLTVAQRSERMARIRSKDTGPEMLVRRVAHHLGYRFRLHRKDLPGRPDLVFPARRKIIFVHGCFWHAHAACSVANRPKTNTLFWEAKFGRNKLRDASNYASLEEGGWKVLVVWECEAGREQLVARRLMEFLGPPHSGCTTAFDGGDHV